MYVEIILRDDPPEPMILGPVVRREFFPITLSNELARGWSVAEIAGARFARAVAVMRGEA